MTLSTLHSRGREWYTSPRLPGILWTAPADYSYLIIGLLNHHPGLALWMGPLGSHCCVERSLEAQFFFSPAHSPVGVCCWFHHGYTFHKPLSCWNSWLSCTPRDSTRWMLFCWPSAVHSWLLPQDGTAAVMLLFFCLLSPFYLHAWSSTHLTVRWGRFCISVIFIL